MEFFPPSENKEKFKYLNVFQHHFKDSEKIMEVFFYSFQLSEHELYFPSYLSFTNYSLF